MRAKSTMLLAVACVCGAAMADVAIWTKVSVDTSTEYAQWGNPSNWTDSAGVMLEVAPTNAADNFAIKMANPNDDGRRIGIKTGKVGGASSSTYLLESEFAVDPTIDSIAGTNGVADTWRYYIQQGEEDSGTHYARERTFMVYNPNDFWGYWRVRGQKNGFALPATDDFVPVLGNLSLQYRPFINVPDAATTGAVGNVYASGALDKQGVGTLSIGASVRQDSVVYLNAGEIVVEGNNADSLDAVLAGAALHLDASRTNTMTFSSFHDDTQYEAYRDQTLVTRWDDVRGSAYPYAYKPGAVGAAWWSMGSSVRAPFVSPAKSPTGLMLVDFGTKGNAKETGPAPVDIIYGPTSCVLRISKLFTNVREAFWVVQTPGSPNSRTVLGTVGNSGLGFMADSKMFATYNAGKIGRTGDLTFNGQPVDFKNGDLQVLTNLTVVSDTVTTGADVELLGSDRFYRIRSGGSRIGEVILFTNLLSRADRGRINDYLVRKWITGDMNTPAIGAVLSTASNVGIGVSDGHVAKVGEIVATDGFTKTGGGELVAEKIVASGGKVVVGGGSLRVAGAPEIVAQVADDPYMWLDASDTDTYVEAEVEDSGDDTYLSAWKDCREGVTLQATARAANAGNYPKVVANATRGLAAIDLGKFGSGKQTYFTLPTWPALGTSTANQKVYAAFIAYRPTITGSINIFGSSNMEMFRQSYSRAIIANNYSASNGKTLGAHWTVNGVSVDPYSVVGADTTINQTNNFVVVAFLADSPVTANGIAKDRNDNVQSILNNCGSMAVGEAIFYHRKLTRDEFRATEAYLMEKWLGKAHPASAASQATLSFAEGVEATINADAAFDVAVLESASSTLRKTGDGAVAVDRLEQAAVADGVSVEGGNLSLRFDFTAKALFHLDAEDSDDAFDTYELDGKTFVTKWRDVRRNGWYAAKTTQKFKYYAITNPTLHQVTMPDGRSRRALRFGPRRNTNDASTTDKLDCAAYKFSSVFSNVREIFTVFSNTGSGGPGEIVGNDTSSLTKANFRRSDGGHILIQDRAETKRVVDGYMAVNGVPRANTYKLANDTPYVISYGTTSNAYAGAVLQDRDCNAGGGIMFEQIAFDYPLTAAERKFMEHGLMYKWGFTNTAPRIAIASIAVVSGAELDVGDIGLQVSALSGGGTVRADHIVVSAGASFAFEYRAANDVDHLTVDGALALDGAATVRVTFAEDAVLEAGEWQLLSATGGITGLDLASLTFNTGLTEKWVASFSVKDGSLWMRLAPKGTMVIFR